jgi:hypothetical protein
MSLLTSAVIALAENPPTDVDPTTGKGAEWGKAAPVGLLIILLMCVAVFFLLRSMTRNMRKVPPSFDPPDDRTVVSSDAGTVVPAADDDPDVRGEAADAERAAPPVAEQAPVDRR